MRKETDEKAWAERLARRHHRRLQGISRESRPARTLARRASVSARAGAEGAQGGRGKGEEAGRGKGAQGDGRQGLGRSRSERRHRRGAEGVSRHPSHRRLRARRPESVSLRWRSGPVRNCGAGAQAGGGTGAQGGRREGLGGGVEGPVTIAGFENLPPSAPGSGAHAAEARKPSRRVGGEVGSARRRAAALRRGGCASRFRPSTCATTCQPATGVAAPLKKSGATRHPTKDASGQRAEQRSNRYHQTMGTVYLRRSKPLHHRRACIRRATWNGSPASRCNGRQKVAARESVADPDDEAEALAPDDGFADDCRDPCIPTRSDMHKKASTTITEGKR